MIYHVHLLFFFFLRLFADDSNIFHTFGAGQKHINMEEVNYHFRKVQTWCNVNKITINLKKKKLYDI